MLEETTVELVVNPRDANLTRGQLERTLSQRIQALYRERFGHRLQNVSVRIFNDKVSIVIEDSVTQPEQFLVEQGDRDLARQVRSELKEGLEPDLKAIVEEVLRVPVIDLLSDAKLESGRTGTIAVLGERPTFRPPARSSS